MKENGDFLVILWKIRESGLGRREQKV